MSYTGDPANSVTDRIRLVIGDTDVDEEGLTDEVIQYVLDTYISEPKSAIECLKFLVAQYANRVTEKVGGLFTKESEKFEQYKKLLDMYTKDPSTALVAFGVYAGGISKQDIEDNACNPDNEVNTSTLRYSLI